MPTLPRLRGVLVPLALAGLLALALAAPAAADDAAFKAAVVPKLQRLAIAELRVGTAVQRLEHHGRSALPKAHRRIHTARHRARGVLRIARHQHPSSARGRHARRTLVHALRVEIRAYGGLDHGLRAIAHHHRARGKRLVMRAVRRLNHARRLGVKAGKLIGGL